MTGRATMAAVAKAAGVSISTVSRVLADKPDISEETRSRVTRAAKETGYVLRKGRQQPQDGTLDVLIEGVTSPWAGELISGVQMAAFSLGYTLALTSTSHPRFSIRDWITVRRARPTDGVILVLSRARHDEIAALADLSAPLILLDPVGTSEPTIPTVGATNWSGGAAAARHLLELGHRRIGFIGGPSEIQCTRERHEGYLAAHREFSLAPDPALTRYGDFLITGGVEHGTALLDLPDPPTAVFAGSDGQAAGVYQVARARGLRIPEDLSVVGFDDTAICTMLAPPLTTVRQPLAEMAAEGVRLIAQEQARPGSSLGRRIELATSLVIRDSTAPPKAVEGKPSAGPGDPLKETGMNGRTTVRMATVAEIANVSQSAVSKVLNGRPGVSAELRRRVMDAVEATGYQWHRRAPRHGSVEVVFGSVGSALNAPLLRGFSAVLRAAGRPLTVSHADGDPDWLEHLLAHRPAGAVLVLSPIQPDVRGRLAEARLPTVVLDTIGDAPVEMNAVGATQWRGGALAAQHLTGLGHRRIALITGPLDLVCCRARFGGYLSALREANIRPDRALIRSVRFQAEPARRAAHTLLDGDSAPTSFVTGNDLQALGVIEACAERGLRVPEDVSVVGFDDIDAARSSAPALTTVRQPFEDMAAESIRVLGTVSDDPSLSPVRLDMSVDLVVRKSTGPAARGDGRRLFPLPEGS